MAGGGVFACVEDKLGTGLRHCGSDLDAIIRRWHGNPALYHCGDIESDVAAAGGRGRRDVRERDGSDRWASVVRHYVLIPRRHDLGQVHASCNTDRMYVNGERGLLNLR
jgi:hypothetical protein